MTKLLYASYQTDNVNGSDYQGEFVDEQLGTSDGTVGNGSVVAQINQTLYHDGYHNNANPYYFTQLGAKVVFMANDGVHGEEMWVTDGTQAGTMILKDINPGSAGSVTTNPPSGPSSFSSAVAPVTVGNEVFFEANDGTGPNELWKTDGTPNGTVLVANFNPQTIHGAPSYLVSFNGDVYFVGNDVQGFQYENSAFPGGPQIWKSDGTITTQVTNIAPSPQSNPTDTLGADAFGLVVAGSNLYFIWNDGSENNTAQQLYVVNSAHPGGLELTTTALSQANLTNVNGELYFTQDDGTHGSELWKSNGTVAGTMLVDDITAGAAGSGESDLTAFKGDVYFFANDGTHGNQLWKSDGTQGGTVRVTGISVNAGGLTNYGQLTAVGNTLFFVANDGGDLTQLWKTDGTTTTMVTNTVGAFNANSLTNIGGTLYMGVNLPAGDGMTNQLWKSDGTTDGTVEVTNNYYDGNGYGQISFLQTPPPPMTVTVQTAGGIDLRWATLYNEMANSPIGAGGTATQYICTDSGQFNGQSAPIKFVVTGTGFTYSGSFPNIQLTGGTITGVQITDSSNTVLATIAGLSIAATDFSSAMASYVAGGATPDTTALDALFMAPVITATGGAGSDRLQGGNFNDTVIGSAGNDTIKGGTGSNTVNYTNLTTPGLFAIIQGGNGTVNKGGANGTDTLNGVQSIIDTGTGRGNGDVFEVDAAENVTGNSANFNYLIELSTSVNLAYGTNFTGISEFVSNTGTNIVTFAGDTHFAYLYGSTGNDTLTLGTGGGYLFGEGGTNVLTGGANAINLFVGGQGGTDTMNGGTGTASNYYFVDGNDQVNGAGAFNAIIELVSGVTVQLGSAQYSHVQEFVAGGGTNIVTVANTDADFTYLYGGAGNDTLTTGSGGGYLFGEGGTNVLNGGGGTSVFVADGASGVDTMNGGTGSNIYFIDANSIVHGAGTFNTVEELQQSASLVLGSASLSNVQQVVFNAGTNSADFHTATASVYLYGGSGNDTLFGGTGNDFLYGGLGTNTFTFGTNWGHDTIEDWTAGTNSVIDLNALASLGVHSVSDLTQTFASGHDVITSSHTGTNSIALLGVSSPLTASSFHFT